MILWILKASTQFDKEKSQQPINRWPKPRISGLQKVVSVPGTAYLATLFLYLATFDPLSVAIF